MSLLLAAALLGLTDHPAAQAAAPGLTDTSAHLRILVASPYLETVNAATDGVPLATRLGFATVSAYHRVSSGHHTVAVAPMGDPAATTAVKPFDIAVDLARRSWVTVLLVHRGGVTGPERGLVLVDQFNVVPSGQTAVRLLHATQDEAAATLAVNGRPLAANVRPFSATGYVPTTPGRLELIVDRAGTTQTLLTTVGTLAPDNLYTVAMVGGAERPLRLVVVRDAAQPAHPDPGALINTGGGGAPARSAGSAPVTAVALLAAALLLLVVLTPRPAVRRLAVAGMAALILVACTRIPAVTRSSPPVSSPAQPSPLRPAHASQRSAQIAHAAVPVSVALPSIKVTARVVPRKLAEADALYRTLDPYEVAWLVGPRPTQVAGPGVTVLAGHVTFGRDQRPGVFANLDRLKQGDHVAVRLSDGRVLDFTVRQVGEYPKTGLPPEMFAATGESELRLITCAGPIGPNGLHVNNVVIFLTESWASG